MTTLQTVAELSEVAALPLVLFWSWLSWSSGMLKPLWKLAKANRWGLRMKVKPDVWEP